MRAMLLERLGPITDTALPLRLVDWPTPTPAANELLVKVSVCGVCHTELDEIEGRTPPPRLPMILGHQAVGHVAACGPGATGFQSGDRVGIAWIHSACGQCDFCRTDRENLCPQFVATGRDAPGGYAEYLTVPAAFAYPIPASLSSVEAAPLLCAGAIGYRSLRLTNLQDGQNLGLTGFGASAHLVLKVVRHQFPRAKVFVFSRTQSEQSFARELGAAWAGDTQAAPPEKLHAIIDTTPAWTPVVSALGNLAPGGRLVVNAIRKEDADQSSLLDLDYARDLWQEKEIQSVANVTRRDVSEFLQLAAALPLRPEVEEYALEDANRALLDLKQKRIRGAKVLRVE
jgi:propanol-preferring alcohol dehydrogenase